LANTGTNQIHGRTFEFFQDLTAGLTYTLSLDWRGTVNNIEATIYEGNLSCMQATQAKL